MKWKLPALFIIFVIISVFLTIPLVSVDTHHAAYNGVIKVSELSKENIINLDGEWEFYWRQLYTPNDFRQNRPPAYQQFVDVPHTWSGTKMAGKELPRFGYATYRLQIILPELEFGTVKAIYMPSVASANRLWINGEEKSKDGIVGTSRAAMVPDNNPRVVTFLADSNPIEVIVQVSNFHQRRGGFDDQILIGELEPILEHREQKLIYRAIIVVSLFVMGLSHIVLFLFRKKELSFLYFAIVCIVVALRATLLEEELSSYWLAFLDWELGTKLEYLGATFGVLFIGLFTGTQFPEEMNSRVKNLMTIVFGCYSLFIIVTPAIIYTRTMVLLQVLLILAVIYNIYVYLKAARRKREGALLNTPAIFILFVTVVNDTLFFNKLIDTTELSSVGLCFFLFTQAIILSKRYSTSFTRTEQLSHQLSLLNASLEQQVRDRTVELEQMNQELNIANQRLHEVQQSKNKWIRNISHEIAAPLTNIRSYSKGMMDGVIPPDPKYMQLIYDQSVYFSRMLHDLHDIAEMENNQIKFEFHLVNIREFIYRLFEKYRYDMEDQGISFTFVDLPLPKSEVRFVRIDSTRMEQVVVNLLKNAQRFVGTEGKIALELAEEKAEQITIRVRDNGAGIKEDELSLIFNRFYKSGTRGKPHNGSGLGLAIAKEIIENHQGTITVLSKIQEGSCFSVTIPLVDEAGPI
ncbi:sensor histidine kinase [Bacillus sp. FJAT-29814]|uniref:sensor histidine kinase n=1 Tax=Bacillus sp. FJAT-29814 TaxID=1729688 RepID=UPI00082DBAC9|nr:sensor histidine kinase [Bacillus sp. FJAT-29814]